MQIEPYTMELQYAWNISLKHTQVADTFIVCGVLYAVDHVDERNTRIRYFILLDILLYTRFFSDSREEHEDKVELDISLFQCTVQ